MEALRSSYTQPPLTYIPPAKKRKCNDGKVQVAVRIRPLSENEYSDCTCINPLPEPLDTLIEVSSTTSTEDSSFSNSTPPSMDSKYKTVQVGDSNRFTFDHVFPPYMTQVELYSTCVNPLVKSCLEGFNATIVAYGQAGSGKTHTIVGNVKEAGNQEHVQSGLELDDEIGALPRAMHDIFLGLEKAELEYEEDNKNDDDSKGTNEQPSLDTSLNKPNFEYQVKVQFLELDGDHVQDLIGARTNTSQNHRRFTPFVTSNMVHRKRKLTGDLSIRDDKAGISTVVLGARSPNVKSAKEALRYFMHGNKIREENRSNEDGASSSHAIFTLFIQQRRTITSDIEMTHRTHIEVVKSKIHFVDLGSSSRMKNYNSNCARLYTNINVNKDLLVLGNVMTVLSKMNKENESQHVPYRDSKLTRVLKGSFGGNHKTLMLACVSPLNSNIDESRHTLRNASNAKNIMNKAKVNLVNQVEDKADTLSGKSLPTHGPNDCVNSRDEIDHSCGNSNKSRKHGKTSTQKRKKAYTSRSFVKNHAAKLNRSYKKKCKSHVVCGNKDSSKTLLSEKQQDMGTDVNLTNLIDEFNDYLHALPAKNKINNEGLEQNKISIHSSPRCKEIHEILKSRKVQVKCKIEAFTKQKESVDSGRSLLEDKAQVKSEIDAFTKQKESVDSVISLLEDGLSSMSISNSIATNDEVSTLSHEQLDKKLRLSEGKLRNSIMALKREQFESNAEKSQPIDSSVKKTSSVTSCDDIPVGIISKNVDHGKEGTISIDNDVNMVSETLSADIACTQTEPLIKIKKDECILDEKNLIMKSDSDLTNNEKTQSEAMDMKDKEITAKCMIERTCEQKINIPKTSYDDINVRSVSEESDDVSGEKEDTVFLDNRIHSTMNDRVSESLIAKVSETLTFSMVETFTADMVCAPTESLVKTDNDICINDEDKLIGRGNSDIKNLETVQTEAVVTIDNVDTAMQVENMMTLKSEQFEPSSGGPQSIDSSIKVDGSGTNAIVIGSMSKDVNRDKEGIEFLQNDKVSDTLTTDITGVQTESLIETDDVECILDEDNLNGSYNDLTNQETVEIEAVDTVETDTPVENMTKLTGEHKGNSPGISDDNINVGNMSDINYGKEDAIFLHNNKQDEVSETFTPKLSESIIIGMACIETKPLVKTDNEICIIDEDNLIGKGDNDVKNQETVQTDSVETIDSVDTAMQVESMMTLKSEQFELSPEGPINESIKMDSSGDSPDDIVIESVSEDANRDKEGTEFLQNDKVSDTLTTDMTGVQTESLIETDDVECILDEDNLIGNGDSDPVNEETMDKIELSETATSCVENCLTVGITTTTTMQDSTQSEGKDDSMRVVASGDKTDDNIEIGNTSDNHTANIQPESQEEKDVSLDNATNETVSRRRWFRSGGGSRTPKKKTFTGKLMNAARSVDRKRNERNRAIKASTTRQVETVGVDLANGNYPQSSPIRTQQITASPKKTPKNFGLRGHHSHVSPIATPKTTGSTGELLHEPSTITPKNTRVRASFPNLSSKRTPKISPFASPNKTPKSTKPRRNLFRASPKRIPKNTKQQLIIPKLSSSDTPPVSPCVSPTRQSVDSCHSLLKKWEKHSLSTEDSGIV